MLSVLLIILFIILLILLTLLIVLLISDRETQKKIIDKINDLYQNIADEISKILGTAESVEEEEMEGLSAEEDDSRYPVRCTARSARAEQFNTFDINKTLPAQEILTLTEWAKDLLPIYLDFLEGNITEDLKIELKTRFTGIIKDHAAILKKYHL